MLPLKKVLTKSLIALMNLAISERLQKGCCTLDMGNSPSISNILYLSIEMRIFGAFSCFLFALPFISAISSLISSSSTATTLSAPEASASTISNSSEALSNIRDIKCNQLPVVLPVRRIKVSSCSSALRFIPGVDRELIFHTGPPADSSRLPKTVDIGDCEIDIRIPRSGETVGGSWEAIRADVINIINECRVQGSRPLLTKGGYVYTGQDGGIRVEVSKKGIFSEEVASA